MAMESSTVNRKMRKRSRQVQKDEEENEEQRIDKFFTLIKSIRETRDRLMQESDHVLKLKESENKRKKKVVEEEKPKQVWKPSFQLEDFMEEAHHRSSSSSSKIDQSQGSPNKEDNKEGLDLRLSL